MSKNLLLAGGGHAHMVTLARLDEFISKGFRVTVVQPSPFHYYSGMGPGMLGGTYEAGDIRFATKTIVERKGGQFVEAKVCRIEPGEQVVYLEGVPEPLPYDVLSCNVGSFVPKDIIMEGGGNVYTSKPIEELQRAKETILEKTAGGEISIAVIGSGPSAVEIAGNIRHLCTKSALHQPRIQLFAGRTFMSCVAAKVQKAVRRILLRKNIEIIEGDYVEKIAQGKVTLENKTDYTAEIIFSAIGVMPSTIFSTSGLAVGSDGGLRVNRYLQSVSYSNIFGGGDCIYFEQDPLDKVGVYAVRQNQVLFNNLMAALEGKPMQEFSKGGSYLQIYNLGSGEGVLSKWSLTISGKLPFLIKDYIDRKFIKTFQK